jgi:hypothetical protein
VLVACLRLPRLRNLTAVFRLCRANCEVSNHKAVHSYNKNNNDPLQFSVSLFHGRDSSDEAHDRIGYKGTFYTPFSNTSSLCLIGDRTYKNR